MGRPLLSLVLVATLAGSSAVGCDGCDDEPTPPRAESPSREAPETRAPEAADEPEEPPDAGPPDAGPPLRIDRSSRFLGEPDHAQRRALATEDVAEIEKGRGGRSLAFKITLSDGTVGYYKPEQSFSAAHWYAEVASYYLDRELGLGRVPPVIGRRMDWEPLREIAAGDERLDEIVVQDDGTVISGRDSLSKATVFAQIVGGGAGEGAAEAADSGAGRGCDHDIGHAGLPCSPRRAGSSP